MADIVSMGELLIDFTPVGNTEDGGLSAQGNPLFEANPGGAPANVAVQAKRAGVSSGFWAGWARTCSEISWSPPCRTAAWRPRA